MSPLEESYKAGVLFGRKAALSEVIDLLTENLYSIEKQRLKELGMESGQAEEPKNEQ